MKKIFALIAVFCIAIVSFVSCTNEAQTEPIVEDTVVVEEVVDTIAIIDDTINAEEIALEEAAL